MNALAYDWATALMPPPRTDTPIRVQRSRAHGWRKPAGCIYVGRPNVCGNPFPVSIYGHERAVELFERWVEYKLSAQEMFTLEHCLGPHVSLQTARLWLKAKLPDLRGHDLCCWCPSKD
jgi:hypothetical protein